MTLHGDTRIDNYYWLRDDTRSQPEVLDYLQQENSYGHRVMASQQALQDRILKEIIDRIPQREVSAPYIKNGYRYRHIYEPGCEYAIYQRQSAFSEEWTSGKHCSMPTSARLIVSFIRWAEWRLRQITPLWHWQKIFFPDGSTAFVFVIWKQVTGTRNCWITLNPALSGQMTRTFYYVRKHPVTLLPYQVWRHAIGTPASQDKLIYEEKDDTYYVSLHKTTSEHYVVIHLASSTTSEVRLLDAEMADAEPFVFLPRRKITNTALITTSIGFICVPTATVKTLAYTVPVCVMSNSGKS